MALTRIRCKHCGKISTFKSYWHWVWKAQFHWLWWDKETKRIRDYRLTRCQHCEMKDWMKREK